MQALVILLHIGPSFLINLTRSRVDILSFHATPSLSYLPPIFTFELTSSKLIIGVRTFSDSKICPVWVKKIREARSETDKTILRMLSIQQNLKGRSRWYQGR